MMFGIVGVISITVFRNFSNMLSIRVFSIEYFSVYFRFLNVFTGDRFMVYIFGNMWLVNNNRGRDWCVVC